MDAARICAIIPARGGSKGVPKKNLRLLAGYPLIAYSIALARLCPVIDRVIVSTDSNEITDLSRRYGAEVPFVRPTALAGDLSPDRDFVLHALGWFQEHEGDVPDYLVHLRPTTPLREPALVEEAIDALVAETEATSLRSGHAAPESPYKWFVQDARGFFHGFEPEDPRPGYSNLPRQLFPAVYVPDGYVDVLRSSFVLGSDDIHGDRILGYRSPVCYEVDGIEILDFLELQLKRAGSTLLDFLNTHYPVEA
jgi:CMP-N,N'-diacetyllegionaminic acid synthase